MPLGIGCDIVANQRLTNKSRAFIEHILVSEEITIYNSLNEAKRLTFLTGRFAAKEALIKAFNSIKKINFLDICILINEDGSPAPAIKTDEQYQVSIAHEQDYTIAYAIVFK